MPSAENGKYHSVHHASRKDHDRIKRAALNGGPYSIEDMQVIVRYPVVAVQCGFKPSDVRHFQATLQALKESQIKDGN